MTTRPRCHLCGYREHGPAGCLVRDGGHSAHETHAVILDGLEAENDTLRAQLAIEKARIATTEPKEPMNLRIFKGNGRWFLRGLGTFGSGDSPEDAMRDFARAINSDLSPEEQWPLRRQP